MPRPVAGIVAAMQRPSADLELEEAAAIFLRGNVGPGRTDVGVGYIARQVVAQVAQRLSTCSATSIRDIKDSVEHFRRDPSLWARDAVIMAVAGAAAELPTSRKGT